VTCIDDLSTGSMENIRHLRARPRFRHVIDTIMNVPLLHELIDEADLVFHLAAAVGVRLIVESPVHTIETNIRGTEIVLNAAAKKRKKVFITSTSEVYGKSTDLPFREDQDSVLGTTTRSRWSYACSKMVDEFLALAYHKERRLPTVVVRLFNTVGPRQSGQYGMVIPTFVRQALEGKPLTVFGDGQQSRSFCHVKDVVGALIGLAEHPDAVGQVFNIGGTDEITIRRLAERIIELTGSRSTIQTVPYDAAYEEGFEDMQRRVPDVTKLNNLIGFAPRYSLDATLRSVIEHEKAPRG
jgi:UDP-glucose 4-epimerase